ncbi:tetratricopeptide repeat protein, partial [Spirillospora sp. NPDC049652]
VLFEATSGDPGRQRRVAETVCLIAAAWPPDLLTGRLLSGLANLYRGVGMLREAAERSEQAVPLLRAAGAAGRNALLTTDRGMAYDLHVLGQYTQALGRMQELHVRSVELFGDSHRQTLFTALNRAVIEHLAGRHGSALEVAREALDVQVARARPGDRLTTRLTHRVGELLTVTGRADEAVHLLSRRLLVLEGQRDGDTYGGLLLRHQLAIARRAAGGPFDGSSPGPPGGPGAADLSKVQREMAAVLGAGDPNALAATFSLAIERAGRSTSRALALAGTCHRGFVDHFSDDHPFVGLCQMAIGAFTLDDGRAAEGLRVCADAAEGLGDRLGESHPWSMAAVLHLARAHGANGRYRKAGELAADVAARAAELLGETHPVHLTARAAVEAADQEVPLPVHHVEVPCT